MAQAPAAAITLAKTSTRYVELEDIDTRLEIVEVTVVCVAKQHSAALGTYQHACDPAAGWHRHMEWPCTQGLPTHTAGGHGTATI